MRTLLLLALALLATRAAVAPVAIDIGTSWLRLAHYNPGSVEGIDVVVSDQGDRRFASVIGFSQGEPVFGDEADSLSQRRPERTVPQLPRLVSFHHGGVVRQGYSADFPRAPLVGLERGDIGAEAGWDHAPSIPELMALVLRYGLAQARAQLNLSVSATDYVPVVLVSPMKAVQPYQLMMVQIAEAAGAYVRNTISTAAAAGIDWAERRLKPTEEQYVIIADIGTLGSAATLLHAVRTRSGHLTLKVIVHAEDDSLGGFRIDQALVKFLKKKVEERRAVVDWSPKREARMLVAARELKEQLSASPQAEVFIEELLPEWDFKLAVTRDEADDACKELYAAFEKTNPVQRLRDDGHLKGITVQNIEVIGGASRIPKVIAALTASGEGIVVARHLSADESVVWGAAEYGRLLTDNMIDLKEPVPPPFYPDSVRPLPEEDVAKLRHVMKAHQEREARKQRKAEARNKLETMLIAAREDTELSEEASEALRAASNWLDDTVETTSLEDFEVKTNEVQAVLKKERSRRGLKEEL